MKHAVLQGCMSLSTFCWSMTAMLRDSAVRRRRRRRRRRPYAPTSNTATHDNHEIIISWVSFVFLYGYGARLRAPL